jgi:hypothetical protein
VSLGYKDNIVNKYTIKRSLACCRGAITKQFTKTTCIKENCLEDLSKKPQCQKKLKSSADSIDQDLDEEAKAEQLRLDKILNSLTKSQN